MAGMYPVINTNYKGLDVVVECNQHDQGNFKSFTLENDLTGVSVRYVIKNQFTGSNVTDWCNVEDAHTVSMVIPVQITREPGTYEAQLIFYTKEYITNSFETWKAAVLAGDTIVNVDHEDNLATVAETEAPSNAVSSFAFYIKVYPSVFHESDQYEGDLLNAVNRMQAQLLQHESVLESLRQQDTALSQNISKAQKAADDAAESAATNTGLANLEGTVTSQRTSITTLQTTSDRHTEQITALQGSNVAGLSQAVSGLETWKQQVLDGQTIVDTLTTEDPPADANSGTEQPSAGTETAKVQEGE
ncbi:hypothetical protein [Faecalibaculum rodentium]|uniref:hypothetical protein n=2 Tax=Faecalibaculum rodentium TaxID=1702221 RepID=UPI0025A30FAA|nr:hypothetical protein [Faecalibaculum rodentium]